MEAVATIVRLTHEQQQELIRQLAYHLWDVCGREEDPGIGYWLWAEDIFTKDRIPAVGKKRQMMERFARYNWELSLRKPDNDYHNWLEAAELVYEIEHKCQKRAGIIY